MNAACDYPNRAYLSCLDKTKINDASGSLGA